MTKVDFYILNQAGQDARQSIGCRLIEKAFNRGHHVYIAVDDQQQAQDLSKDLWTNNPASFLAHQLDNNQALAASPIHIGWKQDYGDHHDVLINLSQELIEHFSQFQRLIEIVDQEEQSLARSRKHFSYFRSRGYPLDTRHIN